MSLKTGPTTDNNIIITDGCHIVRIAQQCSESGRILHINYKHNNILVSWVYNAAHVVLQYTTEAQRSTRAHYFCALLRLVKRKKVKRKKKIVCRIYY